MKRLLTLIMTLLMVIAFSGMATAGIWDTKCIMCHKDGNKMKAKTKAQLKTR
jgi:hypothetical protein